MPDISRRNLLIGGAAAAATAGVLTVEGCNIVTSGGSLAPSGSTGFTLTAQYSDHVFAGKTLRTRTFNGTIPGPTMTVVPGQQFTVTFNNILPPDPVVPIPATAMVYPASSMQEMETGDLTKPSGVAVQTSSIDPMNNPHLFNTTNLHVHGLQVVPHLFDPVGTSDPAALMVAIHPGSTYQYTFQMPADHPTGLYWYHPHHHGSTDTEVGGGMAGLILVKGAIDRVPEIAAARDIQIAFQTLNANQDPANPNIYDLEFNAYQPPSNGGYTPRASYLLALVNGQLVNMIDFTVVNFGASTQFAPPQISIQPGEVVRLRILNGSNALNLPLQLKGFEVYIIGYDGVNLLAPQLLDQTGLNSALIASANRIELLVRAPATAGTYTLSGLAVSEPGVHPWPQFNLMSFAVAGSPVTMNIPSALPTPTREYPLIADSEIVSRRTVAFDSVASTRILNGRALTVNGVLYDETSVMFTLAVGTAEEWTISNRMPEGHPFHLHTNSFEIHSVTDPSGTTNYSPPIIGDTVWIPAKGNAVIRMRFKQWRGKDVFHCHKLPHEDQGMMANTMLV
jgi:FtsP/CotA-like multicopper oxidase with cupredoxin domain